MTEAVLTTLLAGLVGFALYLAAAWVAQDMFPADVLILQQSGTLS